MLLSVIVPIYNVEKYLGKCVQSILNNQCNEMEIILVDDGSIDASKDICDYYSQKYHNIKCIHKNNGGLVSARKTGVQAAQGKYITFVDGDDWVDEKLYINIIKKLKQNVVDVYAFAITRVYSEGKEEVWKNLVENKIYKGIEVKDIIIPSMLCDKTLHMKMMQSVCTKVMLKSLFADNMNDVEDTVRDDEDLLFSLACLRNATTVWVDNTISGYYYRYVENSMSIGYNKDYWKFMEQCCKNLERFKNSGDSGKKENYEYEKIYLLLRGVEKEFSGSNSNDLREKSRIVKEVVRNKMVVGKALKLNRIIKLQVSLEKKFKLLLLKYNMTYILYLYYLYKRYRYSGKTI